jgi:hypothetical protein
VAGVASFEVNGKHQGSSLQACAGNKPRTQPNVVVRKTCGFRTRLTNESRQSLRAEFIADCAGRFDFPAPWLLVADVD